MFKRFLALLLSFTLIAQPAAAGFAHKAEYSSESKTIGLSATTGKVVSRAWGEIPKDIRDQLKGSGKILSIFVPGSAVKALKKRKTGTFKKVEFDKPNELELKKGRNRTPRFSGVNPQNAAESQFIANARATFGERSVWSNITRHRGNLVIQRSDIELSTQNLRRMQNGNSPFVRNANGEWETLSLHHVGRQDGKMIEVLRGQNSYNPANGGPLHIPGPGGPVRQSNLSQTYWQQRFNSLVGSGQVPQSTLTQLGIQ